MYLRASATSNPVRLRIPSRTVSGLFPVPWPFLFRGPRVDQGGEHSCNQPKLSLPCCNWPHPHHSLRRTAPWAFTPPSVSTPSSTPLITARPSSTFPPPFLLLSPDPALADADFEAPSSILLLQHVSADAEGVPTGDAAQARAAAIGAPSLKDRTTPDALLHWLADPERTRATAALMAARARHWELGPGGNATAVPPAEAEGAAEMAVGGLRLRESTVLAFRIQLRLQSLETLLRSQEAVRTLARTLKAHGAALHYAYQTSQGTIAVASLTPEVPTQPSHRHRRAVATAVAAQAALRASGVEAFLGVSSGTVAIGVTGLSEVEEARFKSTAIDLDAVCVAVSDPPAKSSADTPLIESTSSGAPESLAAPADQAAAATETTTPHKTAPGAGGAPAPPPSAGGAPAPSPSAVGAPAPPLSAVGAPYRLACIIAGRPVERALMLANSARRGGPTMLIGRLTAQSARSHQPLTKIAAVQRRGGSGALGLRHFRSCVVYKLDNPAADAPLSDPPHAGAAFSRRDAADDKKRKKTVTGANGGCPDPDTFARSYAVGGAGAEEVRGDAAKSASASSRICHRANPTIHTPHPHRALAGGAPPREASPRPFSPDVAAWLRARGRAVTGASSSPLRHTAGDQLSEAFDVLAGTGSGRVRVASLFTLLRASNVFRDETDLHRLLHKMTNHWRAPEGPEAAAGAAHPLPAHAPFETSWMTLTTAPDAAAPALDAKGRGPKPGWRGSRDARSGCARDARPGSPHDLYVGWPAFASAIEHFTPRTTAGEGSGSLGENAALVLITFAHRKRMAEQMAAAKAGAGGGVGSGPPPPGVGSAAVTGGAENNVMGEAPSGRTGAMGSNSPVPPPPIRRPASSRPSTMAVCAPGREPASPPLVKRSSTLSRLYLDSLESPLIKVRTSGAQPLAPWSRPATAGRPAPAYPPAESLNAMMQEVTNQLGAVDDWRAARAAQQRRSTIPETGHASPRRGGSAGVGRPRTAKATACQPPPPTSQVVRAITHPSRVRLWRETEAAADAPPVEESKREEGGATCPSRTAPATSALREEWWEPPQPSPASFPPHVPQSPRVSDTRGAGWTFRPPMAASSPRGRFAPAPAPPARRPFSAPCRNLVVSSLHARHSTRSTWREGRVVNAQQ